MLKKITNSNCIFLLLIFIFSLNLYSQIGFQQKGKASYYHDKFHGRRTSSGERFNQNKMTAAHRKLNFNTMVKVTNLSNDKSVIVRVNDRGPYKYAGRIIDLTYAAAKQINLIKSGTAMVKIEVIGEGGKIMQKSDAVSFPGSFEAGKTYNYRGEARNPKGYGIQVAAFSEIINAKYFAQQLFREGFREIVIKADLAKNPANSILYKVIVGEFKTLEQSLNLIPKLKIKDFNGFPVNFNDR